MGAVFFWVELSPLWEVLASRLAWLNCRRFLAGAILFERECVVLGVRFSGAVRSHGWRSKLGCFIDDKVA